MCSECDEPVLPRAIVAVKDKYVRGKEKKYACLNCLINQRTYFGVMTESWCAGYRIAARVALWRRRYNERPSQPYLPGIMD